MNIAESRPIATEIFCAKDFYNARGQKNETQCGRVVFSLALPSKGLAIQPQETAIPWIEGVFAQSVQRDIFFETIRKGEIPPPLVTLTSQTHYPDVIYTSPTLLSERDCTIIEALGLSEHVSDLSLAARSIQCFRCSSTLERFRHPRDLIEAILRDWISQRVSVLAESSSVLLSDWATKHGFSTRTSSTGVISIALDEIECSAASIRKLTPSLRALWRIPKLVVACLSKTGVTRYSPHGWCHSCAQVCPDISRGALLKLVASRFSRADTSRPESQLCIEGTTTLGSLLTTPIYRVTANPSPILRTTLDDLTDLQLGHLTLGTSVHVLPPKSLAVLSAYISARNARQVRQLLIVEIPNGIMTEEQTTSLWRFFEKSCRGTPVVYLQDRQPRGLIPETPSEEACRGVSSKPSLGKLVLAGSEGEAWEKVFELRLGEKVKVSLAPRDSRSLLVDIHDALQKKALAEDGRARLESDTPFQVTSLPVFDSMRSSKKMVIDELGFAEPLAQLYAASLDARSMGLTSKDFLVTSSRRNPHLCPGCYGFGVRLSVFPRLPRPIAEPCNTCQGLRFKAPLNRILFRGASLSTILNQSIENSLSLLSALYRSNEVLALITALRLTNLPLGMPLSLLRGHEQRAIRIIGALARAKPTKPSILLVEEPLALLSDEQLHGLQEIQRTQRIREISCWIEISSKDQQKLTTY